MVNIVAYVNLIISVENIYPLVTLENIILENV